MVPQGRRSPTRRAGDRGVGCGERHRGSQGTTGDGASSTTNETGAPALATTDVSGTWSVDTEAGDFDDETATGSFAGFRIEEELARVGSATAVGRTGDVTGTVEIDGSSVTAATFEVDLTTITTNEERRDDNVQDALETSRYPTATFTLTEPIDLGDAAQTGAAVTTTATGDLTIHGVTRSVQFPLEAQLVGETIVVVGSLDLTFGDFDVQVPDSMIVVSVEDHGILELQLLLVRAP
ncbi:MAG: YceI family protein [Acidimicrobiia bacterium]|nr:YceI family protein [Acidimicrobiia bacterium]